MAPRSHGDIEQWNHEPMVSNLQGDKGEQLGLVGGSNQVKSSFSFAYFLSLISIRVVLEAGGAGRAAQEAEREQVRTRQRPPAL